MPIGLTTPDISEDGEAQMEADILIGLIITLSLLCAAGLAAYENPQVRQWIDESRRKVAVALHSLGDELAPDSESRRNSRETTREKSQDASTREDEDPEAVERRRRARQEILDRGRMLEERRRSKQAAAGKAKSFDDLVDKDGTLRSEESTAMTTAAEPQAEETGLRHRHTESQAAAAGSAFANPFGDEMNVSSPAAVQEDEICRSTTPTLPTSPTSPPVPPKPAAYQPQRLLIDTDEVSNHPSEQLLDLTPTTSASSANADLAELNDNHQPLQTNFWSVNEWAQDSGHADFYSPPRSETAGVDDRSEAPIAGSQTHNEEHASQMGSEDLDVLSDDGAGISTPDSWTEVGSQVSEDY